MCGRTQQVKITCSFHEQAYCLFEVWQVIETFKKYPPFPFLNTRLPLDRCNVANLQPETIASSNPRHLILFLLFT